MSDMDHTEQQRDLAARAGQLAAGLAQAQRRLRAALLAGESTGSIREFIIDLEREAADVAGALAEIDQEGAAREAARVADHAAELAVQADARIETAVADIQPPALAGLGQ